MSLTPLISGSTERTARTAVCALATVLASIVLPVPATAAEEGQPDLRPYYTQKLSWDATCGPRNDERLREQGQKAPAHVKRLECVDLRVPRDYARPGESGDIKVALMRLKATGPGERLGSLVLNYGGPGSAGTAKLAGSAQNQAQLNRRYDLVAFDPRGVGLTEPVDCGESGPREDELNETLDASPDTAKEAEAYAASETMRNQRCGRNAGELLPWVGTNNVARDLDVMRQALGDEKLNYLGYSYGTQLGATYMHQHPGQAGRMVLDGVINPAWDTKEEAVQSTKAFDTALDAFVKDCVQRGANTCPLGDDPQEAEAVLSQLNQSLDGKTLPTKTGDLDQAAFSNAIIHALYSKELGWPQLRQALTALGDNDGAPMANLAHKGIAVAPSALPEAIAKPQDPEPFHAIKCRDTSDRYAPQDFMNMAADFVKASPIFGRQLGAQLMQCTNWPVPGDNTWRDVAAPMAPKALLVSTERDPATPYGGGAAMAKALGNASPVLTYDGDGHTAYDPQHPCVSGKANAFLNEGKLPAEDTHCKPHQG